MTSVPILAIRSDNGSEFKNYTLNEFLSKEGIRHQYSAAYTPQQNGVAERKNMTLMDMARSMLAEFKSPLFLCALHSLSLFKPVVLPCWQERNSI